jgi:hypothetical protein
VLIQPLFPLRSVRGSDLIAIIGGRRHMSGISKSGLFNIVVITSWILILGALSSDAAPQELADRILVEKSARKLTLFKRDKVLKQREASIRVAIS